jgi:hypothetical protein
VHQHAVAQSIGIALTGFSLGAPTAGGAAHSSADTGGTTKVAITIAVSSFIISVLAVITFSAGSRRRPNEWSFPRTNLRALAARGGSR